MKTYFIRTSKGSIKRYKNNTNRYHMANPGTVQSKLKFSFTPPITNINNTKDHERNKQMPDILLQFPYWPR